jgi:hypothetical protein
MDKKELVEEVFDCAFRMLAEKKVSKKALYKSLSAVTVEARTQLTGAELPYWYWEAVSIRDSIIDILELYFRQKISRDELNRRLINLKKVRCWVYDS